MAKSQYDLAEWHQFTGRLGRFAQTEQRQIMRQSAEKVGLKLDSIVKAKLPPEVQRKAVSRYWTQKQTRWWWATMHAKAEGRSTALPGWTAQFKTIEGRKTLVISGGYKRTGLLVRSLDFQIEQTAQATTIRYGTNVKYARWVIDQLDQSLYHKGNWPTLQKMVMDALPQLRQTLTDEVFRLTASYFLRG